MISNRHAAVVTPLEQPLLLLSLNGQERLGEPFEYKVELLSETNDLDLSALLGKQVSVELELFDGRVRQFNGLVTHFCFRGQWGRYSRFEAVLRPWLWLLGQTQDSRIFQRLTVPDVVLAVFREHGFSEFEVSLTGDFRIRPYLVQYRESDLNFVQRLLEQEGIYYYFKHADRRHTVVLADANSVREAMTGYETLPYYPPQSGERRERDHVDSWLVARRISPGVVTLRDFDFEHPAADLSVRSEIRRQHEHDHYEVYDYPGEFLTRADGQEQARVRLDALQSDFELIEGAGNVRGLSAGALFSLEKHPREDQNRQHLVIETRYALSVSGYESVEQEGGIACRCEFVALGAERAYRPERRARKPVVEGPQTALVVGPENQEIWTDEHGRVKVEFHWDRRRHSNEESSCWVRVSQLWAGSGFGGVHIPRIGQEVIVDFLEGDPDRPIITGRVYNAFNRPPYELPANQTQSGVRSRSSPRGNSGTFNEIRFQDKKGSEELYIQAEKDQTTKIKNDHTASVGAHQAVTIGANQTITVGAHRTVTVGANETVTVLASRTTTVAGADTETYQSSRTIGVGEADSLTVHGPHIGTYKSGRNVTVNADDTTTVESANKATTVRGAYVVETESFALGSTGAIVLHCPSGTLSAGPPAPGASPGGPPSMLTLVATDALVLRCGENSIRIDKDGISILGAKSVTAFVGDNGLELAPDGATVSSSHTTVTSSGNTDVMGGKVNLRKAPPTARIRKI